MDATGNDNLSLTVLQPNKLWPDWGLNPGLLDIYQVLYH